MKKEEYMKITKKKLRGNPAKIMLEQIERYYQLKTVPSPTNNYKIGDRVLLKKGTLMHGTYKNYEGLKEIIKDGIVSSWFIDGRNAKYPSSVGVWNLTKDYYLDDYINFYSGGTIRYNQMGENAETKTEVIPRDEMANIMRIIESSNFQRWYIEQTKEARFLPSNISGVQIGIIMDGTLANEILKGDLLNEQAINDKDAKKFVNKNYYKRFIVERKNKDDFFTNRESAILFGIPANTIEGILVGRIYENDEKMINEIKKLLPNVYICNLDGKVIA